MLVGMDTSSMVVVHGSVNGSCAECGAPLKWAERALRTPESSSAQVFLVCKNNHRLLDVLAISSLAAPLLT
jgi:hypothetical protein